MAQLELRFTFQRKEDGEKEETMGDSWKNLARSAP